jgi:alkyl sulfatase BDS1-like metallo-beta-lactamase superfamily hydrolase
MEIRSFSQLLLIAFFLPYTLLAQKVSLKKPKPASSIMTQKNSDVLTQLPFKDTTSFTNARSGLIANTPNLKITKPNSSNTVWNMAQYNFLNTPTAPPTVKFS